MDTAASDHTFPARMVPLVVVLICAATIVLLVVLLSIQRSAVTDGASGVTGSTAMTPQPGRAGPVALADEPDIDVAPSDCTGAHRAVPGEYENVSRSGTASATWVIVPDSSERSGPAPLYVLSVVGFTGTTEDLDLVRPLFDTLDGVVVVTAVAGAGHELTTLVDEVARDFCIDRQRIVTSMLPDLSGSSPEPEPPPRPEIV